MRPQIYEETTELDDKKRSGTNREPQEVPQEEEIPQENSEKHPDNLLKVIT